MRPQVSSSLVKRAAEWDELHRWERSELGKDLRRLGLTYGEIRELIPVPKGTLSYWCREIDLTDEQVAATRERTGPDSRLGIPVDTQCAMRSHGSDRRRGVSPWSTSMMPSSSQASSSTGPKGRRHATIFLLPTPILPLIEPLSHGSGHTWICSRDSSCLCIFTRATPSSWRSPIGGKQPAYPKLHSRRRS